jgi:hypothetical protein
MKDPMNDLKRAFVGAARGSEGRPEFFRQLRVSMLSFLVAYQVDNGFQSLVKPKLVKCLSLRVAKSVTP